MDLHETLSSIGDSISDGIAKVGAMGEEKLGEQRALLSLCADFGYMPRRARILGWQGSRLIKTAVTKRYRDTTLRVFEQKIRKTSLTTQAEIRNHGADIRKLVEDACNFLVVEPSRAADYVISGVRLYRWYCKYPALDLLPEPGNPLTYMRGNRIDDPLVDGNGYRL